MRNITFVTLILATLFVLPPALLASPESTARSADGTPIHYFADGAGEPALVFIHGWSCDATYWDNQVPAFAAQHRVVRVDLAGHGASGLQRTRYTLPAFGEDVKAVVEQEKLGKVILIGHSMGGDVMLEAARLLPGRVLGLIAIDTLHDASEKIDPKLLAEWQAAMEKDFPAFVKGFVRGMIPRDTDPALVEKIASDMASAPPAVARSAFAELFAYDEAAGFRAAGAPILAINGTHFPTNAAGNNRFAPFDVVYQEKVGHFGMLEAPAEFNRLLVAAVARIERGGTILRTLRKEVEVKANLQDVWWAWTTLDGVKTFFAPDARIELRPLRRLRDVLRPRCAGRPEGRRGVPGAVPAAHGAGLLRVELPALHPVPPFLRRQDLGRDPTDRDNTWHSQGAPVPARLAARRGLGQGLRLLRPCLGCRPRAAAAPLRLRPAGLEDDVGGAFLPRLRVLSGCVGKIATGMSLLPRSRREG